MFALVQRADLAEVIGAARVAKAARLGARPIAIEDSHSAVAPVSATPVAELRHVGHLLGSRQPYGRMDPPPAFALDEVANICPGAQPNRLAVFLGNLRAA